MFKKFPTTFVLTSLSNSRGHRDKMTQVRIPQLVEMLFHPSNFSQTRRGELLGVKILDLKYSIWQRDLLSCLRASMIRVLEKPLTNSIGITTFGQATMNRKTFWWSKTVCELKSINLSATKKERNELSRGKPWALSWLFDPDFSKWMSPFCWRSKSPKKAGQESWG